MIENNSGIYPTHDKVLVKPFELEEKSKGGIIIPAAAKQREDVAQQVGVLVAIGPTAREMSELHGINEGDTIIYARYAGFGHPGKDGVVYRLMRVTEVVARCDGVFDPNMIVKPSPFI